MNILVMSHFLATKVILNADLNNFNLDDVNFDEDDPETIINVKLLTWSDRFEQCKALKKEISKELSPVARHPTRW